MKSYLSNDFDMTAYPEVADELPFWSAPFAIRLLDKIEYKPGITALDIGFGCGFPLTELAMRLGEESVVYGLDPWKEAAARAAKKIAYYRIRNIRLIEGVMESIPLENHSVDLIVSNNGMNHAADAGQAFSECSRVLRPGGQMVLTLNLDQSMMEFYHELISVLKEMKMEKEIADVYGHIRQKRRPLEETLSLILNHGFEIREAEQDQFMYRFANGTAMLNHYFIRLAFMGSWISLLPGESLEAVFDRVETRLNRRSEAQGGIRLTIPFVVINASRKPEKG